MRVGGGESWLDLGQRVDAALGRLRASLEPGQRALVVTHGGVIRTVLGGLLGFRRGSRRGIAWLRNTAITTVRLGGGGVEVRCLNDAAHARGLEARRSRRADLEWRTAVTMMATRTPDASETVPDDLADAFASVYGPEEGSDLERVLPALAARHHGRRIGLFAPPEAVAAFSRSVLAEGAARVTVATPRPSARATVLVGDQTVLLDYNVSAAPSPRPDRAR